MSSEPTQPSPSPFNRTAQHDAKREAILSQAAKLFNSKGSRATTLHDIAQGLGLTKTSLYYYVKTKEELIYQCYMASLNKHHRTLDDVESNYSTPIERISAYINQHFHSWLEAREGRESHAAALLEIASLKGLHRQEVEASFVHVFKRLRGFIRSGIADGSLRACDATSATRAIFGSTEWSFSWLQHVPRDSLPEVAQQAVDILANGFAAKRGEYKAAPSNVISLPASQHSGFDRDGQNRLKQEAFYKTGTRCFNKQGFTGTSLDEIAEQLNVSKGAFYYHIKNKEDLLYNCYLRSIEINSRILTQAKESQGNGLRKLELTCRSIFHAQNSELGPLIRYNTITALPKERRQLVLQHTDRNNQRFGDFVREGIEDGSVRPISTFVAEHLIAGAINASMDIALWRRVDDLDQAAIDYFDIFFNGLLSRD